MSEHDDARAARAPEAIREIVRGKRFLAADRASMALAEIATWDPFLLREHRLLVPMDVQALWVAPGSAEPMVRLPMLLAGEDGDVAGSPEEGMPAPFAEGTPRPAGVHLHWAMPDALLRGTLEETAGAGNRLALPVLPDRWVVLRILLPVGADQPVLTGWVLEADRAIAVPIAEWTEGGAASRAATPLGLAVDRDELTGTVGGSVTWSAVYDAVLNRFAFHDPLADVDALAPRGVDEDCASYLVAGWWSDPARDPLDAARSGDSLHELLDRLRWRLLYEWGDERWAAQQAQAQQELRDALGLEAADRHSIDRPARPARRGDAPRAAAATTRPYVPMDESFVEQSTRAASSVFSTEALRRFVAPAWHLRSSLLHGAVYGVPVRGAAPVDRRPDPSALAVALGEHDDDLLAAFAAPAGASADGRRAVERLLGAFTAQKVNRLAAADGLVELEEHEHGAGFSSLPAGSAGTDRHLQRVQTGGVGGLGLGRGRAKDVAATRVAARRDAPGEGTPRDAAPRDAAPRHARPAAADAPRAGAVAGSLTFSAKSKPTLIQASAAVINDLARSRVGDVLAPTEARVVDRPAARWTFPDDPMVAVRGASRSLRHGNDGRGSADGKLTCRWPTHVITEVSGVVPRDRFVRTVGSGAVPPEIVTLAREALLHDPYHDEWIAQAVSPGSAVVRQAVLRRLVAESVLRFGDDGTYDGTTVAFHPTMPRTTRGRRAHAARMPIEPGVRERQSLVADEMRKFSLYKGADPDPVGVTAWAQPWVPLWLEWELAVEGLDPPTLERWRLGAVDLERANATIDGETLALRGRALLTAGGATTLHDAITDWLAAEDALDEDGEGQVDEEIEDALRTVSEAVRRLDVVTAALDGVRAQLLGFDAVDGLRRPGDGTTTSNPAPAREPHAVLAGHVRLGRARLLDAFGRTLDVPVDEVRVPQRAVVGERPGALLVAPRLLRPARWQFRLVDAATPVGAEGAEARVDQIEPALEVSPVVGFVMPDHLDESLELFGADGAPLGELLHEPVSGGVMWEIAPGRDGPADAGPLHGLTDAQLALGRFAAGLVAADARERGGRPLDPESDAESALSALLRAIDTTLWSVDTFAALGAEHVAGLVGRPVAVVRAQLRLELRPTDDVDLADPARAAEWEAMMREAARHAFPVRIGEVTRSDDGVLGFFVDDDYSRFRLVDKAIAGAASDGGRSRGQLGLYTRAGEPPPARPIAHGYVLGTDDADTLCLHVGQTVTLTILMHPAGRASLTSGILPRKALALARDWVGPGLAAIAPSLRTGPVLVETDLDPNGEVRLPKVSVFGKDQNFLWRDTPATWRTDAILAATQTALLPDAPAEFREGWIRVAPEKPAPAAGGGAP